RKDCPQQAPHGRSGSAASKNGHIHRYSFGAFSVQVFFELNGNLPEQNRTCGNISIPCANPPSGWTTVTGFQSSVAVIPNVPCPGAAEFGAGPYEPGFGEDPRRRAAAHRRSAVRETVVQIRSASALLPRSAYPISTSGHTGHCCSSSQGLP